MKSFLRKLFGVGKKVFIEVVLPFFNKNRAALLLAGVELLKGVKDSVEEFDLKDPFQRGEAVKRIVMEAAAPGAEWGVKLLAEGADVAVERLLASFDSDLKRYLSIALINEEFIKEAVRLGVPADLQIVNTVVEWALREVREKLEAEQLEAEQSPAA
jgi:hypothetical protein